MKAFVLKIIRNCLLSHWKYVHSLASCYSSVVLLKVTNSWIVYHYHWLLVSYFFTKWTSSTIRNCGSSHVYFFQSLFSHRIFIKMTWNVSTLCVHYLELNYNWLWFSVFLTSWKVTGEYMSCWPFYKAYSHIHYIVYYVVGF